VLPDLPPGQTERPGTLPMLDSIAALSYIAARTRTLKLATGVLLLPQHEPLLLAKQLASVDVLSHGRLIVGLGVGGVEAEAKAIGSPMSERGARANEFLRAVVAIWTQDHPSFHGKHVNFEGVTAYPRPVQKPHPPFVFGGRAPAAMRRTIRYGAGWYGWGLDVATARQLLGLLSEAAANTDRPAGLGPLEITVAPRESLTPEIVREYESLGVHRLLHRVPAAATVPEIEALIRDHAPHSHE
jgi:probable F420-dependent oxidoreductase